MLFRNQETHYFKGIRQYLKGSAKIPPPRQDVKTDIFQHSLSTFESSPLQKARGKVKTDEDHGSTGSQANSIYGSDAAGKLVNMAKMVEKFAEEDETDKSDRNCGHFNAPNMEEERPEKTDRTNKRLNPGAGEGRP